MNRKICIVLVGSPCSGKSTIGKIIANKLNAEYVSSGDIARDMAKNNKKIRDDISKGKLAPEDNMRREISNKLFYHFMIKDRDIIILDGFPRFGEQAKWLRDELPVEIEINYILISVSSWIAKNRAKQRDRYDDNSFNERLLYYKKVTYNELHKLIDKTISTDNMPAEHCADILVDYIIKEVIRC